MKLFLTLLLLAINLHGAVLQDGIIAASDTTGTNATVRSITITAQTNLHAGTLLATNLTPNRALISASDSRLTNSVTTGTELGYVSGVTSAIQTQIDSKQTSDPDLTSLANGITGIVKGAGNGGGYSAATSGTDYAPATSGSSLLKGNGSGGFSNAASGTDYAPATSGTSILKGNGSGGFSAASSTTDYQVPLATVNSVTLGTGAGSTVTLTGDVSGTDTTMTFGNNSLSYSGAFTASGVTGGSFISTSDYVQGVRFGIPARLWIKGGVTDGVMLVQNSSSTDFSLIQFGGTTASFPAIKRSGNALQIRLADDSGNAPLTLGAPNDTTALTVSGGSVTGSGTNATILKTYTNNTTGVVISERNLLTDTASDSKSKFVTWEAPAGTVKGWIGKSGNVMFNLISTPSAAPTIASASTIAPTAPITFISGTTTLDTITAPYPISLTGGQITLIPTGAWATSTSGNIAVVTTAVANKAMILFYDATTTKWYPSY